MENKAVTFFENNLYEQVSGLIKQVAIQANSSLTMLFWSIGKLINQDILGNKRADYSKQIVSTLSTQLKNPSGGSFE
jgi:hypothetical protein